LVCYIWDYISYLMMYYYFTIIIIEDISVQSVTCFRYIRAPDVTLLPSARKDVVIHKNAGIHSCPEWDSNARSK
jgi:hypothetical protein